MLKLKRFLILIWFTFFVCSISVSGQNVWEKKPYLEWSMKDVSVILTDSPWTQTRAVATGCQGLSW